jgi:hypothetical protein
MAAVMVLCCVMTFKSPYTLYERPPRLGKMEAARESKRPWIVAAL